MTRDEAIRRIKAHKAIHKMDEPRAIYISEALDMAIEALEEAKKRETTWDWCTDCKEYDQENHCCHRLNNVIYDTLCGTIVSGEWIYKEIFIDENGKGHIGKYFCSVCGNKELHRSNYCPNCGAYMRGDEDEC